MALDPLNPSAGLRSNAGGLPSGMIPRMGISVVVPVFRSSGTLNELFSRIKSSMRGAPFEVVLVDDGSGDTTWELVKELASGNPEVVGLRLGRNSGQHSALLAGIREAKFPITVTIDDDLQNPPEEIPRLIEALQSTGADVVYGVPINSAQTPWRRSGGWAVRRTMQSALGVDEVINMSSFRAFRTNLRDAFNVRVGPGVSIDALLAWGSSSFTSIEVSHQARAIGSSNYSLSKLTRFALDTMTGYTTVPLRVVSAMGFVTASLGLLLMVGFVLIPFARGLSVQGFPFLASTIILFSGIQLVTLGVIGEYLARMHFRIMNKPEYVIADRQQITPPSDRL